MKRNQYIPITVTHPGVELREKLEELNMPPMEFAVRCNKPNKTISNVLNEKSSITPDMAVQFENVLKIPARYWLKRQSSYDEAIARDNRTTAIEAAKVWVKLFPYPEMVKKKWVVSTRKAEEKIEALFDYFSITSHLAWEKIYIHQGVKASLRISLAHAHSPHALSAWLRRGDIQAQVIQAPKYSAKILKTILPDLKEIVAKQPVNFFQQAQNLCLKAGVKIVCTPCLPKAPINGVARWIENNKTPLIQLSFRHKQNDIFWFSFFHELGHILLHGKKDIFLENVEYEGFDAKKEQEADDFAIEWLFSKKEETDFLANNSFTNDDIIKYAEKFGTHPAMIVGRLHNKGIISYKKGREFIVKINPTE